MMLGGPGEVPDRSVNSGCGFGELAATPDRAATGGHRPDGAPGAPAAGDGRPFAWWSGPPTAGPRSLPASCSRTR